MAGIRPAPPSTFGQKPKQSPAPKGKPDFGMAHSPVLGSQKRSRQINLSGLSSIQVRRILRTRGYDVEIKGGMDQKLKTAIDAYVNHKPPSQYNPWAAKHFGSVVMKGANPHTVAAGGSGTLSGPGGSPPAHAGGGGGKPKGKSSGDPTLASLQSLLNEGSNIGTMIPTSTADDMAGQQYDGAINDLQRAMDQAPAQDAQNLKSIGDWYQTVLDSEAQAGAADHAANDAGKKSVGDAVASIISSLGGSANSGSAGVGAEGANAVGTLSALGNAQDFYNSQVRPLLQSEAAGAKTQESNRAAKARADMLNQLGDLKTQRGQAVNTALADIIDKNNNLAQTRFGDKASVMNTLASMAMTGMKVKAAALKTAAPKPLSPAALSKIAANARGHFLDSNMQLTGQHGMTPQQVVKAVNNEYLSAGLDLGNPQVAQSAMGVLRQLGITPDPAWYGFGGQ